MSSCQLYFCIGNVDIVRYTQVEGCQLLIGFSILCIHGETVIVLRRSRLSKSHDKIYKIIYIPLYTPLHFFPISSCRSKFLSAQLNIMLKVKHVIQFTVFQHISELTTEKGIAVRYHFSHRIAVQASSIASFDSLFLSLWSVLLQLP